MARLAGTAAFCLPLENMRTLLSNCAYFQRWVNAETADAVLDKDLAAPPGAPDDGDRYIVATGGSGAWTGKDDDIAEWDAGGPSWTFTTPAAAETVWVTDEATIYIFSGGSWSAYTAASAADRIIVLAEEEADVTRPVAAIVWGRSQPWRAVKNAGGARNHYQTSGGIRICFEAVEATTYSAYSTAADRMMAFNNDIGEILDDLMELNATDTYINVGEFFKGDGPWRPKKASKRALIGNDIHAVYVGKGGR